MLNLAIFGSGLFLLAATLSSQPAANSRSGAPAGPSPPAGTEATIGSTRQFEFRSTVNGADYRIQIYIPRRAPPAGGYPSIYILDGDALFGSFAEAVRNRSQAGEIEPAVVVGLSGARGAHGADRTFDFTNADMTPKEKLLVKDLGPDPRYGGAQQFLRVIQDEIKPRVAEATSVNPSKTAIFGWSLGGLFVVHVLFEHPDTFASYIALSPALWRSDRAIFREIPEFQQRVLTSHGTPKLFLAVGDREEEATPGLLADEMTTAELSAELKYGRMVGNTRDLARVLEPFFEQHKLQLRAKIFHGETHNSVPWTALNPILNFTLGPTSTPKSP